MKRFKYFLQRLNASFWFLPTVILTIAIILAILFITLDQQVQYEPKGLLKYAFADSANSAETILSTIAAAMIGLAGTVFSITLVVLTLASSQFGSRLLRNFMYDKVNQVVLGTYIATFLYCLIVLNAIKSTDEFGFIPAFAVLVATIAALANIILLIIFIHHIATNIQTDKVIYDISTNLSASIRKIYPQKIGQSIDNTEVPDLDILRTIYDQRTELKSKKSGYLQSISDTDLMELASKYNLIVELLYKPGDYIVENSMLGIIMSTTAITEEIQNEILDSLLLGNLRTTLQDAKHSIHQMVEIASRALSPGINDPYTAITCIDNLTSIMCYLTGIVFPSRYRYDEDEKLRLITDKTNFDGLLDTSFNQIRQFGATSPSVIIKLMEAMMTIYNMSDKAENKKSIARHAGMILRTGQRSFEEPLDVEDLRERYDSIDWDS